MTHLLQLVQNCWNWIKHISQHLSLHNFCLRFIYVSSPFLLFFIFIIILFDFLQTFSVYRDAAKEDPETPWPAILGENSFLLIPLCLTASCPLFFLLRIHYDCLTQNWAILWPSVSWTTQTPLNVFAVVLVSQVVLRCLTSMQSKNYLKVYNSF